MISKEDAALLRLYAEETDSGRWRFGLSLLQTEFGVIPVEHDPEDALMIIRACLLLGTRVTDTVTSNAWYAVVTKLAELTTRIDYLEQQLA